MQSFKDHIEEQVHSAGTVVTFPHQGKMTSGKVVRHDKGDRHGVPFYVIDHGSGVSEKVPAHKVEKYAVFHEEASQTKWAPAVKTAHHYQGQINGKTFVVPHSSLNIYRKGGYAEPMRHAIVTSLHHVQHNNPDLTPEEHTRVHEHIKAIHGGQAPAKLHEGHQIGNTVHYRLGHEGHLRVGKVVKLEKEHVVVKRGRFNYKVPHSTIVNSEKLEESAIKVTTTPATRKEIKGARPMRPGAAERFMRRFAAETDLEKKEKLNEAGIARPKWKHRLQTPNPFKVGDKVKLHPEALKHHAQSVPAHAGYSKEGFAWREHLGKLEGHVGTVSRVFDSGHTNVDFHSGTIGIEHKSLVPHSVKEEYEYPDPGPRGASKPKDATKERALSPAEDAKKEDIVHGMKKNLQGFKERYGKDAKSVMYATATKQAKKLAEDTILNEVIAHGDEVEISHNYGVDSGKRGTVLHPNKVRTNGRGVPIDVPGAYKPVDHKKEHVVKLHSGSYAVVPKGSLTKLKEDAINEDVFSHHQTKIAKSTLRMSDAGAHIMGGMNKDEARKHLKKVGWTDKMIHHHEHDTLYAPTKLKEGEDHGSNFIDKERTDAKMSRRQRFAAASKEKREKEENKEKQLSEEAHPGFVMNFSSHTEHQYHGFAKAKQDRDAYAEHLKSLGHKVKKGSTANQLLHGTYGNVYHVSYKPDHLKEESYYYNMGGTHTGQFVTAKSEEDAHKKVVRRHGAPAVHLKLAIKDRSKEEQLKEATLDKPTHSPEDIAKRHGVTVEQIEAQLKDGIKIEQEHTSDLKVAREIALDHLGERPDYYTKLERAKLEEGDTMDKSQLVNEEVHAYNVHHNGKHVDTVFYGHHEDPAEVKKSLVNHDGYHPDIRVTKQRNKREAVKEEAGLDKVKKNEYLDKSGKFDYKKFSSDRKKNPQKFIAGVKESSQTLKTVKRVLAEMSTRKHFQQVADLIKAHPNAKKRQELANHHAEVFASQNPRFSHELFHKAAGTQYTHPATGDVRTGANNMKKFSELKEESNSLPGKIHKYNGYAIREHGGKFHIQAAPHTGTLSFHTTKEAAKSRVDYYNRLPQTGALRRDKSDLVREWIDYSTRAIQEETERERKSHAVRMAPAPTPEELHKDNEANAQIEAKAKTAKGIKETVEYKVGDRVVAKIGPHKGEVHKVIHVHDSGHINITPVTGGRNRYHLGAAKASPEDVTKHLTEAKFEHTYCSQCGKDLGPGDHGCSHCSNHRGKSNTTNMPKLAARRRREEAKKGINSETVQEAFEAAKEKKKGENPFAKKDTNKKLAPKKDGKDTKVKPSDFDKPKDLKDKGMADPEQAEVQAQPPQFGGKGKGADEKTEKKDNTPTPEKKGNKLIVKGPGPDDKFQPDPIVTPVTTLPDTASARSGSQGVR